MTSLLPGKPYPLGATWDGEGVNFALFAEHASGVELCLFDELQASIESVRIPLGVQTDQVWHVYVPGLKPGQLYAYRVRGQYEPQQGLRYNPYKLLIDPYARALTGDVAWNDALFGYPVGTDPDVDLQMDERDSAPYMPRCVVIDPAFDWGDDRKPNTPLNESIIYETHVKGFTKLHPEVPEALRGSYAGLATQPMVDYLKWLGITAVELMPVHQFVDDRYLMEQGKRNYWGYNSLAFFAPEYLYSSSGTCGEQVREFKTMVKALHAAGIEVILDVVYNHTAEGNHMGPTFSMKGIDNPTYYRLVNDNERYYMDYTGTGNSVNVLQPRALQLIMDSLRYWVTEMHVDGFRFDLAATLARGLYEGDRLSAFFDTIHQDPVLSQVKLIAEPWDIGPGGYQVGNFPVLWAEWNGKYRDTVRRYWKGDEAQVAELAYRLSGSSDLYQHNGRSPYASVNFITAHDGFTLRDLVSYNEKHNDANGEGNRDGESHNNSWNCGAEGPTDDKDIRALRARQQRNMLATMLLSQGVPMLLAGDERNRSQQGNNNAYCQDNELSWLNWELDDDARTLLNFTHDLIELRKKHPVLHRRTFFQGRSIAGYEVADIEWYRADGVKMGNEEWSNGYMRCLGMLLNGQLMNEFDERSIPITDDVVLILMNAHHEPVQFKLPGSPDGPEWSVLLDTTSLDAEKKTLPTGASYELQSRSLVLLCQPGEKWAELHGTTPLQENATTPPAEVLEEENSSVTGTVVTITAFWSPQLGNARDILVYLPPGYNEGTERYPVVYMQDGQKLFNQATNPDGEWRVDEAMQALSNSGLNAIVVGITSVEGHEIDEYSPYADQRAGGGWGDHYLSFIIDSLKPYIDEGFRTLPDREHTGILGSAMGGFLSLYAFFQRAESFGFVGALSPSFQFAGRAIFETIEQAQGQPGRIYLDCNEDEGQGIVEDAQRMRDLLQTKGYQPDKDILYTEESHTPHSSEEWQQRMQKALTFLLTQQ